MCNQASRDLVRSRAISCDLVAAAVAGDAAGAEHAAAVRRAFGSQTQGDHA